ncbi:hypothetical protein P5673_026244 [Acropora cervicornis]|uniref:Uncharacterized protein n=1 Tax=Acropora cervicornis TaxID=6130 RepID=A0AAD9Q0P2_ACRCE|nr:hypothetical protein P5673_026244 [Acropora cervicornis]
MRMNIVNKTSTVCLPGSYMVRHFFTNRLVLAFFIVAYHLKFWTCLKMLRGLSIRSFPTTANA